MLQFCETSIDSDFKLICNSKPIEIEYLPSCSQAKEKSVYEDIINQSEVSREFLEF